MQNARMLGFYAKQRSESANYSVSDLSNALDCSEMKVKQFFSGRAFLSFEQLQKLADLLGTTVSDLMAGDSDSYETALVHCMNDFDDIANREMILDLIDDYLDIADSGRY